MGPSIAFVGIDCKTIAKMLATSVPSGYRRSGPPRRSKLDLFSGNIDRILEEDQEFHRKQRHTAKKIFERLRIQTFLARSLTAQKDPNRSFAAEPSMTASRPKLTNCA